MSSAKNNRSSGGRSAAGGDKSPAEQTTNNPVMSAASKQRLAPAASSSASPPSAAIRRLFLTPSGLPRLSTVITAAQLQQVKQLKRTVRQALSSRPGTGLEVKSAWSSLYSDALLSCFAYLELRDLSSTVRVCRGWQQRIRTGRLLHVKASFNQTSLFHFQPATTSTASILGHILLDLCTTDLLASAGEIVRGWIVSAAGIERQISSREDYLRRYPDRPLAHVLRSPLGRHVTTLQLVNDFDSSRMSTACALKASFDRSAMGRGLPEWYCLWELPHLQTVEYSTTQTDRYGTLQFQMDLVGLNNLRHLRRMRLDIRTAAKCEFSLGELEYVPSLEHFELKMQLLDEEYRGQAVPLDIRTELGRLPMQLHTLILSGVRLLHIPPMECPLLTHLEALDETVGAFLRGAPNLTTLKIVGWRIDSASLHLLPELEHLTSLTATLDLSTLMDEEQAYGVHIEEMQAPEMEGVLANRFDTFPPNSSWMQAVCLCTSLTSLDIPLPPEDWSLICQMLPQLRQIRAFLHHIERTPRLIDLSSARRLEDLTLVGQIADFTEYLEYLLPTLPERLHTLSHHSFTFLTEPPPDPLDLARVLDLLRGRPDLCRLDYVESRGGEGEPWTREEKVYTVARMRA